MQLMKDLKVCCDALIVSLYGCQLSSVRQDFASIDQWKLALRERNCVN